MLADKVRSYKEEIAQCWCELSIPMLQKIVIELLAVKGLGGKIYIIGNGGSASTASHMAVDLNKGAGLPAISLTDNVGLITAWANDEHYNVVFLEQLRNILTSDDVVIGISASGNSSNILIAINYAHRCGATTVGFIGMGGGELKKVVDYDITVSSKNYGVIEDFHLSLNHLLAQCIKERQ